MLPEENTSRIVNRIAFHAVDDVVHILESCLGEHIDADSASSAGAAHGEKHIVGGCYRAYACGKVEQRRHRILLFSASHSYDWLATGIFHAIAKGVLCDKVVYYVRSFNCFLMILYLRFFASSDRR